MALSGELNSTDSFFITLHYSPTLCVATNLLPPGDARRRDRPIKKSLVVFTYVIVHCKLERWHHMRQRRRYLYNKKYYVINIKSNI